MAGFGDIFFDLDDQVISEEEASAFNATPGVIFLIDVRNRMLALDNDMKIQPVMLSLQCIRQWIRNFIFASAKCFCSIILVGSGKQRNAVDSKNIYSVLDLKLVDADAVKLIDHLMNLVKTGNFEGEYGSGDFSLADALWISSNMFTELKKKLTKHVILFTNDGCPFPKPQDRVRVFAKIADMKTSKISFELIPLGTGFEYKFYKELLDEMGDGWEDEKFSRVLKLDDAIDRGPKPTPHHVPLANVPFVISEDFSIPIQIHSLVVEVKIPYAVTLSKATNTPVSTKTTFVPEGSGGREESQEAASLTNVADGTEKMGNLLRYESVGSECVLFTESEMEEINAVGLRQLRLLGFKPRSTLSLEHHTQPCGFVYPDEKRAKGASQFFRALMESCKKKDVVAICSFCPRPTSTVRYVALDVHVSPPGFLMITLPFGDEVRDTEEECLQSADSAPTEQQVDIMENVVKKLKVVFDPKNFPNPQLAAYWAGIEALALDLPQQEEIVDASNPNVEEMSDRLGDLTNQFYSSFFPEGPSSSSSAPSRTPRRCDTIADIAAVEENYQNGSLNRLTLDQLKVYLRSVGLGIGLSKKKKADLISIVTRYLEKN